MQIEFVKGEKHDDILITRDDGSAARIVFPKKGPIPHDAVHLIVEEELGLANAFWGMIAAGRHPEEIQAIAKEAGHASAKRAREPDPSIIELLQAERIVECFEAEFWSAPADKETLQGVIDAACASSFAPSIKIGDEALARIRARLAALGEEWMRAPAGFRLHYQWAGARSG